MLLHCLVDTEWSAAFHLLPAVRNPHSLFQDILLRQRLLLPNSGSGLVLAEEILREELPVLHLWS